MLDFYLLSALPDNVGFFKLKNPTLSGMKMRQRFFWSDFKSHLKLEKIAKLLSKDNRKSKKESAKKIQRCEEQGLTHVFSASW